ncbi:tryptophan/tyrosine permease [Dulcicalothrix desertica PCC 7102]|uniref:Tryptophan/tyrosine permease n=1 Tax=Dulcicalothrix desertica PCC 7102 TaxID=232991 RepID=A0A3S1ABB6_9CYAN|nr:aromatic amino acid transport family protein [Dulcicalothrix desertica]RUS97592.1 tryptophan/tyrosine permease [Dulcicalothrix desertica PCC 7102]TWH54802.1 tyrosine-specific transport protein [Dulcicalothrix desertica PCC 7102]
MQTTRLFSNIEFNGDKILHQPGSVLGSTALIAGTTVGAGILALPTVTLPSGVAPSTVSLIAVWLYALVSGLLIAEVSLDGMRNSGASSSFLAMVENILGKPGAILAGGAYLFLHYGLLVAYIAQGGEILLVTLPVDLPNWAGTTIFGLLFGGVMYFGHPKLIEKLNNALVFVVIASFTGLLFLASRQVHLSQFAFQDWTKLTAAIPVMLVALFYHNVIPVIAIQLEGDARKVKQSIFFGSLIPLLMFIAWNAVILGSVDSELLKNFTGAEKFDPLENLRGGSGGNLLEIMVSVFSEVAIITSFIGFFYGLLNFLDVVKLSTARPLTYGLVLFPPMCLAVLNPNIFLNALETAGAFCISVLGAIIPALMVWKRRRDNENIHNYRRLVPGGKTTLVIVISIAILVIFNKILSFIK